MHASLISRKLRDGSCGSESDTGLRALSPGCGILCGLRSLVCIALKRLKDWHSERPCSCDCCKGRESSTTSLPGESIARYDIKSPQPDRVAHRFIATLLLHSDTWPAPLGAPLLHVYHTLRYAFARERFGSILHLTKQRFPSGSSCRARPAPQLTCPARPCASC